MASYIFKLPDLGEGVVEGEIIAWHVQPGDTVNEDQPLVDVMTDKATVTIPSVVTGRVTEVQGNVGELVAVGSNLIQFDVDGENTPEDKENASASHSNGSSAPETLPLPNLGGLPLVMPDAAPLVDRPLASPAVRRRAREKGVDLKKVAGTGRAGRITDGDIDNFLRSGGAVPGRAGRAKRTGTKEVHLAGLRRRMAEKMSTSNANIPHFSYIEQVDVTELSNLRKYMNEHKTSDDPKLSYLPFIMIALAKAFEKFPEANAHFDSDKEMVTRFEAVHLGIATQTERGLYVPVVQHVEAMDLREAARELHRVTRATHHSTIRREELSGSTFTITSLGKMGGLAATPIINHPEVGILGIHKAYDRPVVHRGQIAIRHMVNLSASFDHRIVDGMEGASLIQCLKDYLEHPALIFIE